MKFSRWPSDIPPLWRKRPRPIQHSGGGSPTPEITELLSFLYSECCTRNKAKKAEKIIQLCK